MAKRIKSRLREHVYRLSLERENSGGPRITQTEIAESTGLTQTTVSMWMNVQKPLSRIDTEAWLSLADFIGVKPEEMLSIEDDGQKIRPRHHEANSLVLVR